MRLFIATMLALGAAGCTTVGGSRNGDVYDRVLTAQADPGAVVATELAFARAAQEKGQWTAFIEFSTKDAVMFVPQVINAHAFLKGRANPPAAVKWQPHEVWSSCDGSLAITRGAAQWPDGGAGEFLTVWQRQSDGAYRWVADMGQRLATPLTAPDIIATHVADCRKPIPSAQRTVQAADEAAKGQSLDGSLQYAIFTEEAGTRVMMMLWDGTWEMIGPKVFAPL